MESRMALFLTRRWAWTKTQRKSDRNRVPRGVAASASEGTGQVQLPDTFPKAQQYRPHRTLIFRALSGTFPVAPGPANPQGTQWGKPVLLVQALPGKRQADGRNNRDNGMRI